MVDGFKLVPNLISSQPEDPEVVEAVEGESLYLDKLVFRQVENLEVLHLGEDSLRHRRKPVLGQEQLLQRRQAAEASGLE